MEEQNKYLQEKTKRYRSFLKELRAEGLLDEITEIQIANISLEDLIAVKLELTARTMKRPMFGLTLWRNIGKIVKDAVLRAAISITQTPSEGAALLGLTLEEFAKLTKKFHINRYIIDRLAIKRKELRNSKGKNISPV